MKILESNSVSRTYATGKQALLGVDLAIERGESVALIGKNGAGKSTLIRLVMGILAADSGSMRVFGVDPFLQQVEVRRRIGYMAEDQVLPAGLKVADAFALHASLFPTWDEDLASELTTRYSIDRKAALGLMSKGQARQVALVCALAHRPELLVLDEPGGGLDPSTRRNFLESTIHALSDSGATVLFSSHHMSDLERIASRIVMLHEGRVLLDRPLDVLREGFSMAVLAGRNGTCSAVLDRMEGCVATRQRGANVHAVFECEMGALEQRLAAEFGSGAAQMRTLNLEDLFVELAEGAR